MPMMGYFGDFGWWGGLNMLLMSVFWIGLLGLLVWAVASLVPRRTEPSAAPSPIEILKARYARGEISKVEYEELKKDLS